MKRFALALVAIHFAVVIVHAIAHEVLPVEASAAQLAFIIPVIIVAPVLAAIVLLKREKAGAILFTAAMLASLIFGVYYHFIADTIDHVSHVAHMQPVFWSQTFAATAYLLAISESLAAVLGLVWLVKKLT